MVPAGKAAQTWHKSSPFFTLVLLRPLSPPSQGKGYEENQKNGKFGGCSHAGLPLHSFKALDQLTLDWGARQEYGDRQTGGKRACMRQGPSPRESEPQARGAGQVKRSASSTTSWKQTRPLRALATFLHLSTSGRRQNKLVGLFRQLINYDNQLTE